jgi:hypothetical protein
MINMEKKMKVPFKSAIVDHFHWGQITVEYSPDASYYCDVPQYLNVDNPETGYIELIDCEVVKVLS